MFTYLYRFLFGYVCFTAHGGFTERFLNLCGKNEIHLWSLTRSDSTITACTSAKDYKKIRVCTSRSGMKAAIASKHGLPFFIQKHRKRIGLLYGAVFAVCFLSIMSTMIWSINVNGNNAVTEQQIIEALAQAGVKHGTFRKSVDAVSVRFYVMEKLPEISYITLNVLGSCLEVKVAEQADAPRLSDTSVPCDVVSRFDGQIAALEVYHGTALHKKGEAVRKGEALVGGFTELTNGAVKFRHAEAYAVLRTDITVSTVTDASPTVSELTNEKSGITLHIFGLDIPLYKRPQEAPTLVRTRILTLNSVRMPFSVTREIYRTYSKKSVDFDGKKLALSAAENHCTQKAAALSDAHVCSQKLTVTHSDKGVSVKGEYFAEVSAGVAKEMLTE